MVYKVTYSDASALHQLATSILPIKKAFEKYKSYYSLVNP